MARGVRKSAMEKLTEQLEEIQASIRQYEECLVTLREKEVEILDGIEREKFKELSSLLKERDMSIDDLKVMVAEYQGG